MGFYPANTHPFFNEERGTSLQITRLASRIPSMRPQHADNSDSEAARSLCHPSMKPCLFTMGRATVGRSRSLRSHAFNEALPFHHGQDKTAGSVVVSTAPSMRPCPFTMGRSVQSANNAVSTSLQLRPRPFTMGRRANCARMP